MDIELGTNDDYTRWATALTEDWLPNILDGLVEKGPAKTVVDIAELHRRETLVSDLLAAARRAESALEALEGLTAYEDFEAKAT